MDKKYLIILGIICIACFSIFFYQFTNSVDTFIIINETEVQDGSAKKLPMYLNYYVTEKGDVWTIYVINGSVFAYPASYNLESDREMLVSESAEIVSYDNVTNQFYVTAPDNSIIIKVVDRIDAETLEKLTMEDIRG